MSSAIFTCNSCASQFATSDLQRYHMKTEWHRYNLKRRIAELPPVLADEFAEKLQISQREQGRNQVDEFGFSILPAPHENRGSAKKKHHKTILKNLDHEDMSEYQRAKSHHHRMRKVASNAESVDSELSHLTLESELATNTDFGEDTISEYSFTTSESGFATDHNDEDEVDNILLPEGDKDGAADIAVVSHTRCIYCGVENKEVERNVKHMFHLHGLYIPERSYLINLPGLLNFLINKIVIDLECLCCNFHGLSLESIRAHMNSKRHCRMPYETKEERTLFAAFYDFSSIDEVEGEDETVKRKSDKKIHFDEPVEPEENDAGEYDINSNYTTVTVDESTGMEMTLPSGTRLGHRAGQRYYRQNLPSPSEDSESRRTVTASDRRLVSGVTEKQYKKGLKKMQQLEKRILDDRSRKETRRANFQTHYRDELLQ
ncbi:Reh1p KNAG_0B06050 [Huiozyma naganishii CBS 8797]|uniref:C2H2-type domain-containing protein n=1 Tax=Huiozyma naganishii (strain ATCC MYA-139 / BCRC 22969 / CBS 8797 / KCTC 17520 / NBRC 10181 / NCYC 3082 / Yp74L-3) TaxID=1071383 RepID=J7R2J9_HUIN7|nr:hypothetical protein KNAG_0B06050 [Kazachstania naganishii CBS 8797]CCK69035.1 hypothetical protein KNAG_0B06050 [Kazachstania naganishii CBS 8797]